MVSEENQMPDCPCCSGRLLRHIRRAKVYWFCPECWQEMPYPADESQGFGAGLMRGLRSQPVSESSIDD